MKFQKAKLIEAAKLAIQFHKDRQDGYERQVKRNEARHVAAWHTKYDGDVKAARDLLTKVIRNGTPLTPKMLEDAGLHGSGSNERVVVPVFRPYDPTDRSTNWGAVPKNELGIELLGKGPTSRIPVLESFLAFLELVEDDIVTQSALQRAGWGSLDFVLNPS